MKYQLVILMLIVSNTVYAAKVGDKFVYDRSRIIQTDPNDKMDPNIRANLDGHKVVEKTEATVIEVSGSMITYDEHGIENDWNNPDKIIESSRKVQINCKTHKYRPWGVGGSVYGITDSGEPTEKPIKIEEPGWADWENTSRSKGNKKEGESGYFDRLMCKK
jgi:hypothetical protein